MIKMIKTWIITDTHFGHENIIKYCNRPSNFSELILNNLFCIEDGDILIHLGDFCIGSDKYWNKVFFARLPKITSVLVRGNHDKKTDNWYLRNGWSFVCDSFCSKGFIFSHRPIDEINNIHGHQHNKFNYDSNILISLELNKYKPILFDKIKNENTNNGHRNKP